MPPRPIQMMALALSLITIAATGFITWPTAEASSPTGARVSAAPNGSPIFTAAPYDPAAQRRKPFKVLGESRPLPAGSLQVRRERVAPVNAQIAAWSAAFALMAGGFTAPPQAARDFAGATR
ncbi:MAG: hypothetical protein AAGD34_03035 [Pseudomonadota bacterium]